MGTCGSGRAGNTSNSAGGKLTGDISMAQMVNASKNSISFNKDVTILPDGYRPESGRKKDLGTLIDKYNIEEVVINMYRDKSGANDLQRMKDLGFEIQAQTKGESQAGSAIPPRDYYYMVRTGKPKTNNTNASSTKPTKKKTNKKANVGNEPIKVGTDRNQRRIARVSKQQTRSQKYGRPKGAQ